VGLPAKAGPDPSGLRFGDLRRRRFDPRADPCHRRAHQAGAGAGTGRPPDLRRRHLRRGRGGGAALLGGWHPPCGRPARRCSQRRRLHSAFARICLCRRPRCGIETSCRLRDLGCRLSGNASRGSQRRGRPRQSQTQDRRRCDAGDHPVLFRHRGLHALRRAGAGGRHHGTDRARNPARHQRGTGTRICGKMRCRHSRLDGRTV